MRALLIGGDQDGKVMDVQGHTVRGWVPPKPGLDPQTGIIWGQHVEYHRVEVEVFSTKIPVYVLAGWPQERVEATLADLLLTPLAKSLADG